MEIKVIQKRISDKEILVLVEGEVDIQTVPEFEKKLNEIVNLGYERIVLSLDGLEFIDTNGIGVLLSIHKKIRDRKGTLSLICTKPFCRKIFHITGLERFFSIFQDVEQAGFDAAEKREASHGG